MEDNKGMSAKEAVQFIKDGNYTVMGKKVPGFLFPDIKLFNQTRNQFKDIDFSLEIAAQQIEDGTFTTTSDGTLTTTSDGTLQSTSTNENLTSVGKGVPLGPNRPQPMSVLKYPEPSQADTDTMIGATKPVVKQIVPEEDKPEPVVSDMPMGSKPLDVSDKEIDEIINYQGESGNPYLDQFTDSKKGITTPFDKVVAKNIQDPSDIGKQQQIIKAVEDRQAEREQNQAKVKEETKKETFQQKINRRGGFKAGGIASKKPKKKKVMKRGGLASKK